MELSEFQKTTKVVKETREGSNEANTLFLDAVTDMIQTGITSKHAKESIFAFKAFARVISAKLDMSNVTNSWAN